MVLLGLILLSWEAALSIWVGRVLALQGKPTAFAWKRLWLSPLVWGGLAMVSGSISTWAAGGLMAAMVLAFVIQIAIGVRDFPRVWRLLGDADAWRGERAL